MIDSAVSNSSAAGRGGFKQASLRKQRLYSEYASGQLSLDDLTARVSAIKPTPAPLSRKKRLVMVVAAAFTALLIPPWARRDDS